jgi:hypothetical protein
MTMAMETQSGTTDELVAVGLAAQLEGPKDFWPICSFAVAGHSRWRVYVFKVLVESKKK